MGVLLQAAFQFPGKVPAFRLRGIVPQHQAGLAGEPGQAQPEHGDCLQGQQGHKGQPAPAGGQHFHGLEGRQVQLEQQHQDDEHEKGRGRFQQGREKRHVSYLRKGRMGDPPRELPAGRAAPARTVEPVRAHHRARQRDVRNGGKDRRSDGRPQDFNDVRPEDFDYWIDWAKKAGVGLDFNGTFFSHPNVKDNMTLSSPDPEIRKYWIQHGKLAREIANYIGEQLGQKVINNLWIPDGFKDNPIDKRAPRERLLESLDEIEAKDYPEANMDDAFEGKLFGAPGIESYTTGSHLFYNNYALTRNKLWTIDAGHFHPTEDVSDKFSAFLPFAKKDIYMHVSRPIRWDSDHVVILDDALIRIARSIVRDNYLDRIHVGLDFFDATINRVAAWVVGARATQQALLMALLEPTQQLKDSEYAADFTTRLAETEALKSYPFGAVWDKFCEEEGAPVGLDWLTNLRQYEQDVQLKRN